MKRMVTPEPKKKTATEQIQDMMIYLVVVAVVYYTIVFIVRIITAPFKYLFMTDKQRFEARLSIARAKIQARTEARAAFETSESNPMYQYLVRFKFSPDEYKGDSENASYKQWFKNMKKGNVLDTELKWAPDVYVKDLNGENMYNGDFLDYFARQVELHGAAGLDAKIKFMVTIQKFYPEFTPRFSVLSKEIKDLRARLGVKERHDELVMVINGGGIPLELAENIAEGMNTPAKVTVAAKVVQICLAREYGQAMCRFCVEHNFNPDLHEGYFSDAVNDILESTGNEEMALALVRGELGAGEIDGLVKRALRESKGNAGELLVNINREFFSVMKSKTIKEMVGR